VKVKGQNVFVPKYAQVYLGDVLTTSGTATADDKSVRLRAQFTRTALVGNVEMVPVVTQVTPIFEGGSQGRPVPVTQLIQAPDVRTNKIDRTVTVPTNGTLVLGGWKEPADARHTKSAPKAEPAEDKPAGEFEVVVLLTVRVIRAADERPATEARVYKLRNVAAADVAHALTGYARTNKQSAVVVAEAVSNSVCVLGTPDTHTQVAGLIAALDKEPLLMPLQALILDVPDGFMARTGLGADTKGGNAWTLSPRETQMFGALLRTAKEKGECDVLSRPQVSVADGQTGYVQIGQSFPVQTAGGAVGFRPTGITLRVTPSALPDGKSVKLAAELRNVTVKVAPPATLALPWVAVPLPAASVFSAEVVGGRAVAPIGHTVVFAGDPRVVVCGSVDGNGRRSEYTEKRQTIVVLTPHLVAPPAQVVPAAGAPSK
ncbi:MAG TPA: secretin N-terminal domain-containing protein, partial [Gemmata sp.]